MKKMKKKLVHKKNRGRKKGKFELKNHRESTAIKSF